MMRHTPSSTQDERLQRYAWKHVEDAMPLLMQWIHNYWAHPEHRLVYQPSPPGSVLESLPADMPEEGTTAETVLQDFDRLIAPGLLHWNHPGFFGFFPSNTSGPAVAAATLSAAINVNPFSWNAGPSATELEMRIIQWLGRAIGLPWRGTLQDTASSATLCAVIAAREQALKAVGCESVREAPQLVAYASAEAHNSVAKAIHLAGIGPAGLRTLPTRSDLSLDPAALEQAIAEDRKQGRLPFFVCSTLGSTSSTAFDDVAANAAALASHDVPIWHHVDAALAGSAALLPEMSWMMRGCAAADSFVFNPHKWLFTNFDCSVLLVRQPDVYKAALSADAAYLQNHTPLAPLPEHEQATEDFRNWSLQLGHGFRGLKLWFVLRCYGKQQLTSMIREHLRLTKELHGRFEAQSEIFETLAKPQLNTICFRLRSGEGHTRALHQNLTTRGKVYLTPTVVRGVFWIRVAIGQTAVLPEDIDTLWHEILAAAQLQLATT